jgi:glycosyltransferase involved in cell wall biosynthesis
MRIAIVRTMPEFSMDVYADGIISGLRTVRPDWEIVELKPHPVDRKSQSPLLRIQKIYERLWHFPQQVTQQKADIFHIIDHSEAHITYWLKKTGKAVVVTCHDLINFYSRENLSNSVRLPLISRGLWIQAINGMKRADRVITVSNMTARDTTKILDIQPAYISVIPNAVESTFKPLSQECIDSFRSKYGIYSETICLLNIGSNHPRKNISRILEVIDILNQRGLPIHFWKAGADFSDEQKLFIDNQGLQKHISYLGKPDKSTLIEIYNAADILLAPSLHEGFGITLLEAMACGTPVITSKVSAMPEVVGDAGILVDPNDPQAIADAVCELQANQGYRQELITKGLARAKQFTWENTAENIAKLYENLIANNS